MGNAINTSARKHGFRTGRLRAGRSQNPHLKDRVEDKFTTVDDDVARTVLFLTSFDSNAL